MDLTLQVTKKESMNMSSLVKQMCSLKCRINVDLLSGRISIVDMDDENVESVIDAINEAFDITSVDIVPTVVVPEPELPVATKDSEVCEQANEMLRVIHCAMYSNNAKSSDICEYLRTTSEEIAMKYNSKEPTEVSIGDVENDDDMLSFGATEESDSTEKPSDEKISEFPVDVTTDTRVKDSFAETNEKVSAEDYLSCIFSNALDSLDKTKSIEDSVNEFLDAIGMSKTEEIIRNSFIVACSVKKINYASINIELHNLLPNVREETIQETLKKEFKKWLAIHPDLKESCPKISIMALLKIFAKKMAL